MYRSGAEDRRSYDRMALDQAWMDGFYGPGRGQYFTPAESSRSESVPPEETSAVPPLQIIEGETQIGRFQLPTALAVRPLSPKMMSPVRPPAPIPSAIDLFPNMRLRR